MIIVKDLSVSFDLICSELRLKKNLEALSEEKKENPILNESILFDKVCFDIENKKIIQDISFKIKKGQFIAIVGKSGSGKSTIIDLLMGLLKPTKGKIIIDNKDMFQNNRFSSKLFGYVPQDIYLLDDTIKKNVVLGVPQNEIDQKKLDRAIKLSQLDKFLKSDGNTIDTIVGNRGIKLSGGELQRVGIARALYNNPDVIILDEATANLDHKTAEAFINSIIDLKEKKTIIFATHQPELIKNCDNVIYIDEGKLKSEN